MNRLLRDDPFCLGTSWLLFSFDASNMESVTMDVEADCDLWDGMPVGSGSMFGGPSGGTNGLRSCLVRIGELVDIFASLFT